MSKHSNDKYMNSVTLPEVLKVEDIQLFLGIGRVQAYELIKKNEFHSVKIGRAIRVSKSIFLKWFNGEFAS